MVGQVYSQFSYNKIYMFDVFHLKGERKSGREREKENLNLNLNLNLFLFYNGYKLGRMPLFIWPLIQNYNLRTTKNKFE